MLTTLAFLPTFGGYELLMIAFVGLLFFGHRLPSVMRSMGKSVTEFKKGLNDAEEEDAALTKDKAASSANAGSPTNADRPA